MKVSGWGQFGIDRYYVELWTTRPVSVVVGQESIGDDDPVESSCAVTAVRGVEITPGVEYDAFTILVDDDGQDCGDTAERFTVRYDPRNRESFEHMRDTILAYKEREEGRMRPELERFFPQKVDFREVGPEPLPKDSPLGQMFTRIEERHAAGELSDEELRAAQIAAIDATSALEEPDA